MEHSAASVLIIEDDPRIESLERALLEERGYSVVSAASGEDAIDLVSDSDPDLILLDIGLPGIDGFTACKVIRKFSETPIIMVTASNSVSDKVKGMETGADDYITKPFSHEEFLARASTVLRRANFPQKNQHQPAPDAKEPPQYTVRREGKAPKNNVTSPERNQRWESLRSKYQALRERLARDLPIIKQELIKDGRTVYVNATGQEVPARNPSEPVWRYYWLIASTLTAAVTKFAIHQGKSTSELVYHQAKFRIKRSLANHRARKSVRGVHYSNGAVMERSSAESVKNQPSSVSPKATAAEPEEIVQTYDTVQLEVPEPEVAVSKVAVSDEEELSVAVTDVIQPRIKPLSRSVTSTEQSANLRFLDALLGAYLVQAEARCEDPMLASPVIPLVEIYPLVGQSLNRGAGYTKEDFAQDLYRLQSVGLDTTQTGAKVQFPISRGVPGKILTTVDGGGAEVRYYGIRFIQTEQQTDNPAAGRTFDLLEGPLYELEIRELLGKQLEWPSTEFAAFLAAQIQLGELSNTELRLLAQITRDAMRRLVQDQTAIPNGSLQVTKQE